MKKTVLLTMALYVAFSCTTTRYSQTIETNRELLKEYFLFKCLNYGYPNIKLDNYDHSLSVYFDLSNYDFKAYGIIDSIAKKFVNGINNEGTYYEGDSTKGIFYISFEYYKSQQFDNLIKGLDQYMTDSISP